MINPKKNIALNLFTLRKYHKLPQAEVADNIGVSRQVIAKW
ncbi:MAG: helix-turn-helix domain-containing protein [Acutalibacteraceae bacterium]